MSAINHICDAGFYMKLVRNFHTTFDNKIFNGPEKAPFEVHKLSAALIREEIKEYSEATERIEILDALADCTYVAAWVAVTYSIPGGLYVTSHDFSGDKPEIYHRASSVLNDLDSMFPCIKHLKPGLNYFINRCEAVAELHYGFKFREAFIAVHNNNMDKLWSAPPDDHSLTAVKKGNKYLVKNALGKVIKPLDHKKVDLTPFI